MSITEIYNRYRRLLRETVDMRVLLFPYGVWTLVIALYSMEYLAHLEQTEFDPGNMLVIYAILIVGFITVPWLFLIFWYPSNDRKYAALKKYQYSGSLPLLNDALYSRWSAMGDRCRVICLKKNNHYVIFTEGRGIDAMRIAYAVITSNADCIDVNLVSAYSWGVWLVDILLLIPLVRSLLFRSIDPFHTPLYQQAEAAIRWAQEEGSRSGLPGGLSQNISAKEA